MSNAHYPEQLLARCREIDPTFKVVFLVHDEIEFECKDEHRDAIMDLMQEHTLSEVMKDFPSGKVVVDAILEEEF